MCSYRDRLRSVRTLTAAAGALTGTRRMRTGCGRLPCEQVFAHFMHIEAEGIDHLTTERSCRSTGSTIHRGRTGTPTARRAFYDRADNPASRLIDRHEGNKERIAANQLPARSSTAVFAAAMASFA